VSGKVTPTNASGKFFAQLFGVPSLTPTTQLDVGTVLNKVYVANIAQSPQGKGSRVESLVLAPF